MGHTENRTTKAIGRKVCYRCMRPEPDCYCSAIPSVDNRIPVLIFQHRRERPHPFNTARMVALALKRCRLVVDRNAELAKLAHELILPGAGLLYPAPDAKDLNQLSKSECPNQLVVLDGTWHHAKTLYRDISCLQRLPKYKINPLQPGNYRIRCEPTFDSLSTVEATVAAISAMEPETVGISNMIEAFNRMIELQLAHPKNGSEYTHQNVPTRTPINIPGVVLDDLENVVVGYGESVGFERITGEAPRVRKPVFWVAQRLISGERFHAAIQQPEFLPTEAMLHHLELSADTFQKAVSVEEFQNRWKRFLRKDDKLVVFNHSTWSLLNNVDADFVPCFNLKTVHFDPHRKYSTLEQFYAATGESIEEPELPGRAGKRLANVKSFVHFLHRLGNSFRTG